MVTQNHSTTEDPIDIDDMQDDEPAEKLDLWDISSDLEDRIRWARATVGLIVSDEQTESAITNAADAAAAHLVEAEGLIEKLGQWRIENKPEKPRDLKYGIERDKEKRDLVRRLLRLRGRDLMEVQALSVAIDMAPTEAQIEAIALIERAEPIEYIVSFLRLRGVGRYCRAG